MFKNLLKRIFPRSFLKQGFLIYNKVKIATIDRLLFPVHPIPEESYRIKRNVPVYDELQIDESQLDPKIVAGLALWHGWTQDEYLLHNKARCVIEPRYGWGTLNNRLILDSLGFGRAPYVRKPNWYALRVGSKKFIQLQKVISLRDTGEENYFHFYNDILVKILWLEDVFGIDDYVLLVSPTLFKRPYFQFFAKNSTLFKDKKWRIQEADEYIESSDVVFAKPLTHNRTYLDLIAGSVFISPQASIREERIFLTRSRKRMRYLENDEEIHQLVSAYGFKTVDTDDLSIEDQISTFKSAKCIIGIHGAGLVNIIFAEKLVQLVEILPPQDYVPFHYIMLCQMYGIEYNAVMGKKNEWAKSGFYLDPRKLESMLEMIKV